MYSVEDVMTFVSQEDVRFIRLTFFDIFGRQKNISILPDQLERAFGKGIAVDAFAVPGFENEIHGDLYLKPDPSTFTILPWRSVDGSVVLMICSLVYPDGRPFEKDLRMQLKEAVQDACALGISLRMSTEFEFYLFRNDEKGNPTSIPLDTGGYLDVSPLDHGENIRREICFTLEEMGLQPQASYHQCGPGQNEVDFHASAPCRAADEASLFKWVVRTVASTNGLRADFTPRPLPDEPGNGLHVNMQVESADFLNPIDEEEAFRHFMA
ncbi:glutamine synthetase beta-grasp domain-containing protein, partial [Faecalibaculum rodentium]